MAAPEVSHGRGGAGNINPDDTQYVDGEVVRVGVEGSHGDGAFSTGRGGSGNIGDPKTSAPKRADAVLVPEAASAVRASGEPQGFHTGRGGAGNEYVSDAGSKEGSKEGSAGEDADGAGDQGKGDAPVGLVDKLKGKLFGGLRKK